MRKRDHTGELGLVVILACVIAGLCAVAWLLSSSVLGVRGSMGDTGYPETRDTYGIHH